MKMKVMIPLFKVYMSKTAKDEAGKVLDSGYIGQGSKVDEFEVKLKERFKNDHVVTTNSATSAEHLAIHLLKKPYVGIPSFGGQSFTPTNWGGIKDGDEVLSTPLTCTASNFPILANNLKIKWVDVDPKTLNMDMDDLARKISPTTKVIMLVHWGGNPIDLDRVAEIQEQAYQNFGFKPSVIEDCAHAFGSSFKGQPIGSHGNICTFSFQAIKHLTSVDGGALVVPHQNLYDRAKLLRWYGIDRENNKKDFRCEMNIPEWGYKFHMNDVNATIGMENLKEVDENVIQKHKDNAKFYNENLKDVPGVTLLDVDPRMDSSYWIYSMMVDKKQEFMDWMKECGIMVSQVHERNDIHTCVNEYKTILPNLDKIAPRLISIPVGWWVTEEERQYIVDCIKKGWG
jgi:dTDP-4-amino-4,6-dideoxy-D-glucose/dTDP-4-amino-2,4-dideoxy-beta-L-xylose transaminase